MELLLFVLQNTVLSYFVKSILQNYSLNINYLNGFKLYVRSVEATCLRRNTPAALSGIKSLYCLWGVLNI